MRAVLLFTLFLVACEVTPVARTWEVELPPGEACRVIRVGPVNVAKAACYLVCQWKYTRTNATTTYHELMSPAPCDWLGLDLKIEAGEPRR